MITRNYVDKDSFWITNFSRSDVTLYDLGITIKAHKSINLLDSKHYSFTREQLEASMTSGYLFSKRDKISIRKTLPNELLQDNNATWHPISDQPLERQARSIIEPEQIYYEELNVDDVEYANENADFAEQDRTERWKK